MRENTGEDLDRFSAKSVRMEYSKLNRQVHRFKQKIEKYGAFMKMTKVPFDSKYKKVLAHANEYIMQVSAYRA